MSAPRGVLFHVRATARACKAAEDAGLGLCPQFSIFVPASMFEAASGVASKVFGLGPSKRRDELTVDSWGIHFSLHMDRS